VRRLECGGRAHQKLQPLDILAIEWRGHINVDDVAERGTVVPQAQANAHIA
jgi:hypothetical protein